jgi:hypothetical protein
MAARYMGSPDPNASASTNVSERAQLAVHRLSSSLVDAVMDSSSSASMGRSFELLSDTLVQRTAGRFRGLRSYPMKWN